MRTLFQVAAQQKMMSSGAHKEAKWHELSEGINGETSDG